MPLNILIIDDNNDFGKSISIFLKKNGHKAKYVKSAIAGLNIAKEGHTDVILLDLLLAKIDGLIIFDLLQKDLPNIIVIIVTGLPKDDKRVKMALNTGAEEYLQKPFDFIDLVAILNRVNKQKVVKTARLRTISIIGLSGAGKTSLLNRFIYNSFPNTTITLGIDIEFYSFQGFPIKIMDLGGQDVFKEIFWEQTIKISDGLIFVFDPSSTESDQLKSKQWLWEVIEEWIRAEIPLIIVANKSDLAEIDIYKILNYLELSRLTKTNHSFHILSTSAKTGRGVVNAFEWIFNRVLSKGAPRLDFSRLIILDPEKSILFDYQFIPEPLNNSSDSLANHILNISNKKIDSTSIFRSLEKYNGNQSLAILKKKGFAIGFLSDYEEDNILWNKLENIVDYCIYSLLKGENTGERDNQLDWVIKHKFIEFLPDNPRGDLTHDDLLIIIAQWNASIGSQVINWYPKNTHLDLQHIASTCFMASFSIFGHSSDYEPSTVSLPIRYIEKEARILFDHVENDHDDSITFAVISIVDSLEKLDLNSYDSIIMNERAQKTNTTKWDNASLKSLHTLLLNQSTKR